MRILHVVTLVALDGSFGGPTTVALAQAEALRRRGHEVTVAAGTVDDPAAVQAAVNGPVVLFPVRRWVPAGPAAVVSPSMIRWILLHRKDFDVVHVHLGRDGVSMPAAMAALWSRLPLAVQPHGMIAPDTRRWIAPIDAAATRPVLRRASAVLHLTSRELADLLVVARAALPNVLVRNGVRSRDRRIRPPVGPPVVLFLARLHPRKGVRIFAETARALAEEGVEARFRVVGPDAGEGAWLTAAVARTSSLVWGGAAAPNEVESELRAAAVFVLPSVDEPYPMAVLEAMSVGVPVVVTTSCGVASAVRFHECGVVVEPTTAAVAEAVRRLLDDPVESERLGGNGHHAVGTAFGMATIAAELDVVYTAAITDRPPDSRTPRRDGLSRRGVVRGIRMLLRRAP